MQGDTIQKDIELVKKWETTPVSPRWEGMNDTAETVYPIFWNAPNRARQMAELRSTVPLDPNPIPTQAPWQTTSSGSSQPNGVLRSQG